MGSLKFVETAAISDCYYASYQVFCCLSSVRAGWILLHNESNSK